MKTVVGFFFWFAFSNYVGVLHCILTSDVTRTVNVQGLFQ